MSTVKKLTSCVVRSDPCALTTGCNDPVLQGVVRLPPTTAVTGLKTPRMNQKHHKYTNTIKEALFLTGKAIVVHLSWNRDSALNGATCPRLLPPAVAQHHPQHLPAHHGAGQATSAPSCPVSVPALHTPAQQTGVGGTRSWKWKKAWGLYHPSITSTVSIVNAQQELGEQTQHCSTRGWSSYMYRVQISHTVYAVYSQYPIHICQQMALIICWTCPLPRCAFLKTVNGDGTCSDPGWFMGYYIPLVYLPVVPTVSAGSVLWRKLESWGDVEQKCPSAAGGA